MTPDCQRIRELMDSYLSEELSVETNHQVLGHLATCQACASEVKRRQRLRALLAQSLAMPIDVERARRRISEAIDRDGRSWGRAVQGWGVAAALIIGLGVVAFWLSRSVDASAYDDSAGNHVACALELPPATTYDPARAARDLAPPFEPIAAGIGLVHGPYHVIDAHMCPYKGHDYVHVVLRGNGRTLSVFIEPAGRGALPDAPVRTALAGGELDVYSTTRLGYHVSAVATPEHRLFLVGDRPTDARDEITNEILLSAVRFTRTLER